MPDMTNSESQTRLSAIMFSDIVGYSKMMQESESLAMTLLKRHNEIIREALSKHEGKEIKVIGDAFLISFATVANAVRCAVEIQEQFGKYNESAVEKEKILLRIGIHMGDIIVKDNDVFGDGVNIASRIEPLAEPGGICVSQEVYNLVRHKLDLQVVSLGPKELKNIKDKIEIYEIIVGSISKKAHRAKRRRKHRKTLIYTIAGVVIVVFGLLIALRMLIKPPSNMVTRILKIGTNNAIDPNISPDGNWIVYVARDSRMNANIFVVSSSGGEPRKVLHDTTEYFRYPCFSPDASQIVYSKDDGSQINIVPTLGGASRKLVNNAKHPRWSPDGKHIAFFRSNGKELFLVNPDGTGEKEITRFSNEWAFNVAWSPDSKRLAFLRSFQTPENGQYTEIFSHALDDSTEYQITFEKKDIAGLCWASTGEIIFSSNRGGGVNLWIMAEGGGTPMQLTVGAGGDREPCISRDAQHLVYLNNFESINVWTIDLQNKQLQQLTFEDAILGSMSYSLDGNRLIYFRQNSTNESEDGFVVCNSDGNERTRLLPIIDNYTPVLDLGVHWSSDMRSVYFSGVRHDTLKKNPDSIAVKHSFFEFVLATNETRKIGDGALVDISRDGRYLIYAPDLNSSVQTVLAETSAPNKPIKTEITTKLNKYTRFSWDSKSAITPQPDSNNSGSTKRIWITSLDERKKEFWINAPNNFHLVEPMPDGKSLLGTIHNEVLHIADLVKLHVESGKIEEITKLPSRSVVFLGGYYNGSITPDGKTLAFGIYDFNSRIMVLDNFR